MIPSATHTAIAVATAITLFSPALIAAFEVPRWQAERQVLLQEVERDMMNAQRRLSAARRQNLDEEKLEELHENFTRLRTQRIAVLRAMREIR